MSGKRSGMMDRRVRKTREALYSAFAALVAERGYDRLSIQDISDEADVGRTTFYAHFKTKDDLLRFGFVRLREHLELLPRSTPEDRRAFLAALLGHAKSHTGLFAALVRGGGAGLAEAEFSSIIEDVVASEVGEGERRGTMLAMLSGALVTAIRRWVDAGAKGSGAEIIEAFEVLLKAAR
jgi:AcrR family transcriptional regulator